MKSRRIVVTAFLLCACLIIGVGYAALNDDLVVKGIRVHSQVRNCLLGRLGMLGLGDLRLDLFDLFALGAGQLNLAPLFSLISHLGQYG